MCGASSCSGGGTRAYRNTQEVGCRASALFRVLQRLITRTASDTPHTKTPCVQPQRKEKEEKKRKKKEQVQCTSRVYNQGGWWCITMLRRGGACHARPRRAPLLPPVFGPEQQISLLLPLFFANYRGPRCALMKIIRLWSSLSNHYSFFQPLQRTPFVLNSGSK